MPGLWHVADPVTRESVKIYTDRRNALAWARKNPYPGPVANAQD